jgi:hypothetical protein
MGCLTHAANVSARVITLPCCFLPLQVPCDLAASFLSKMGSILKRYYVQTQGNTTVLEPFGGWGHGVPNMPCFWYLFSWTHSALRNSSHSSSDLALRLDSLGRARPFMIAKRRESSSMVGHVSGLSHSVSPVRIARKWGAITFS